MTSPTPPGPQEQPEDPEGSTSPSRPVVTPPTTPPTTPPLVPPGQQASYPPPGGYGPTPAHGAGPPPAPGPTPTYGPAPTYGPTARPDLPTRPDRPARRTGSAWTVFLAALLAGAVGAGGAVTVVDLVRDARSDSSERGSDDDGASRDDGAPAEGAADLPPMTTPGDDALASAVSETREDSVYPEVGDPVVDALHYAIDLSWFPDEADELTATTTLTFRATQDRADFQLDLAQNLSVSAVEVDGATAGWEHSGKDLVVTSPVVADQRYTVAITYAGPPEPAEAPTTRSDFEGGVGLTRSDGEHDGWLWTMQEPYGAFTWYPVNDQPADKALYDVTVHTQPGWKGVANGVLTEEVETTEESVTRFTADAPLPSYLATLAVGEYELTEDTSDSGVPLYYWTPVGDDDALAALQETRSALAYVEDLLGPYPFSSLGSVVVDSDSAMETQTMITYGNTDYTLSPATIVHEIAHHWYGNKVSPADWSDVWMNEGMATYVQLLYEAQEEYGVPEDEYVAFYAEENAGLRAESGPPAAYDPAQFAESNIYIIPGVMWHELRRTIGDEAFWAMVRAWPTHAGEAFVSVDRSAYLPWVSQQVGRDLSGFFASWLLAEAQPPITFG